jgi:hypothetical protein
MGAALPAGDGTYLKAGSTGRAGEAGGGGGVESKSRSARMITRDRAGGTD